MNSSYGIVASWLGALGLIPFVVCSILVANQQSLLGANPLWLFIGYSAVILAFLGGSLWGRTICNTARPSGKNMLILSNAIALLAWAGLLTVSGAVHLGLLLLLFGFIVVLLTDWWSYRLADEGVSAGYMTLRAVLTTLVAITHLIVIGFLVWSATLP